jgi:hypothetical protein
VLRLWVGEVRNCGSIPSREKFLSSPKYLVQLQGSHNLFIGELGSVTPEIKWPGCEVDPSPPSTAEVKNEWGYNFTPPTHFHGMHRNIINFLLYVAKA